MIKTVDEIKKGDIVIYRNGHINHVNHPKNYRNWYRKDFNQLESKRWIDIITIKRYVKILWFYKLKTIYVRKEK